MRSLSAPSFIFCALIGAAIITFIPPIAGNASRDVDDEILSDRFEMFLVSPARATLKVGDELVIEMFSAYPGSDISWTMDTPDVVEFDEDQLLLEAVNTGEVALTATNPVSGASASTVVSVRQELTSENNARAVQETIIEDEEGDYPVPVNVLEDGTRVPLMNADRFQYYEDRAPDFSTQADPSTRPRSAGTRSLPSPAQERISLDAWQSPIRHQMDRNTCSAFTVVAAMEAAFKRAGYDDVELSEHFLHHIGKQQYLYPWHDNDEDPTQDGFENSIGMRGNAGVVDTLSRIMFYGGVPLEEHAPYRHSGWGPHGWRDLERTNQDGDDPYVTSDRDGSILQSTANSYNMEHEPTTYHIPEEKTFAPLPQEAIENAVYGITGYERASSSQRRDPAWYEWQIAQGREILGSFNYLRTGPDDDGVLHPRDREEEENDAFHAMLIVGYDRQDPDNPYFIVKNSWGESGYIKLSYDFAHGNKHGQIRGAAYITGVTSTSLHNPRPILYIGGWRIVRDGQGGSLDIHRRSGYYDPSRLGGEIDNRLGAHFRLGDTYRVNGWIGDDETAEFYIDRDFGNLPYGALEGDRHEAYIHPEKATLMAGSFYDPNNVRRPFYANKGEHWQGTYRFTHLWHNSFLGQWEVHSAAADGFVHIDGVNESDNSFVGASVSPDTPGGEYFMAISGSANPATQEISFNLPSSPWVDESVSFEGQIHTHSPGTISGLAMANGETYPMVLIRTGSATQEVNIIQPESNATYTEGETIPLQSEVFEDGLPVDDPHIIWTLGGPLDDDDAMQIGSGANTATKRGAGQHDIYANYVGHGVHDQVTIVVQAAGDPNVTIESPEDGEFIHYPYDIPNIHVDCVGSASSPQGNPLVLRWYYREEGDTEWIDSGETGSEVTLVVPDNSIGNMYYELMLEATDDQGNVGVDIISFSGRAWQG